MAAGRTASAHGAAETRASIQRSGQVTTQRLGRDRSRGVQPNDSFGGPGPRRVWAGTRGIPTRAWAGAQATSTDRRSGSGARCYPPRRHSILSLRANAQVQLRGNQIEARGEAARNPKLPRQLQRSLGDTVEMSDLRAPAIELTVLVQSSGDHPIDPLIQNRRRYGCRLGRTGDGPLLS